MPALISCALFVIALLQAPQSATVSSQRFVGTWVGVQGWAIDNPPPGARQDQPVTLTIDMVDGKLAGTLVPFMGGQDGATFIDAQIVGDELQASAVVGRRRAVAAPANGDAAAAPPSGRRLFFEGWKDSVKITMAFKNDGVNLTGTADVLMGDVKWLKFRYDLARKRSRY